MVIDLRKIRKDGIMTKLSLVSKNTFDEGGFNFFNFFRGAKKVGGDQVNFISVVNYAGEVGKSQGNGINVINYAGEVGKGQVNILNGINYTGEVGTNQVNLASGINRAGEVGRDQQNSLNGINYTGEVGRDQMNFISVINYTRRVGMDQRGGMISIQTENKMANQKGLILYNALEGIVLGSSVWNKVERAETYLSKLEKNSSQKEYKKYLGIFSQHKPSLFKKITGHNTKTDILARQSKKRLKNL